MRTYYPIMNPSYGVLTGTLCEWCVHAVPNGADHGCSWSIRGLPVENWIATKTLRIYNGRNYHSYCVHECPQFQEEGDHET